LDRGLVKNVHVVVIVVVVVVVVDIGTHIVTVRLL
jgi:hypothetical protein